MTQRGKSERIRRLTIWALFHLLPRSPAREVRDEQMASLQLYPTEKRGVRWAPKEEPRDVDAPGATVQSEMRSYGHFAF